MVFRIKGLKIKDGKLPDGFMELVDIKHKLPFEATGLVVSKNEHLIPNQMKVKEVPETKVEEPKVEVKPIEVVSKQVEEVKVSKPVVKKSKKKFLGVF